MPKSKVRKKDSTPLSLDRRTPVKVRSVGPSHPIYVAVMLAMMLIGLLWLVVNYLAGDQLPFMSELGAWNFAVGFGFMIIGLLMTMQWR